MMKRLLAANLSLLLVLSMASCTLFKKEPVTEPPSTEPVAADSKYTTMASCSQIVKGLVVPEILLDSPAAKAANAEIIALFDSTSTEYEELISEAAKGPKLSYKSAVYKNALSVLVTREPGEFDASGNKYFAYCFNTDTGDKLDAVSLYALCGYTADEVRSLVQLERKDFFVYWDVERNLLTPGKTVETFTNADLGRYDAALKEGRVGIYADDNGEIALFFERSYPGAQNDIGIAPFIVEKDRRLFATKNPARDALIAVVNSPDDATMKAANPKNSFTVDENGEKLLITALQDGTDIQIRRATYDNLWKKHLVKEVLMEQEALKMGQCVLLTANRPESGTDVIQIAATVDGIRCEYTVLYNGKYGTQPIEFAYGKSIADVELTADSNMLQLAGVIASENYLKLHNEKEGLGYYLVEGYYEWRTIAAAVTLCHPQTFVQKDGSFLVPTAFVTEYAAALFAGNIGLKTIPPVLIANGTVKYISSTGDYLIKPLKYDGISCEFVKTLKDLEYGTNGMCVRLTDSNRKLVTLWDVNMKQNTNYNPDAFFDHNIISASCQNPDVVKNYIQVTTAYTPTTANPQVPTGAPGVTGVRPTTPPATAAPKPSTTHSPITEAPTTKAPVTEPSPYQYTVPEPTTAATQ